MSTASPTAEGKPSRPAIPEWAPGVDIGRYTLLARIAMGGMAEIWLARQTGARGFEKLVVVKRIRDHLGNNEDFIEMFLDEARIAAQLSHPGIVQIFDLGSYGDAYFIAMEYLCGEPLNRVIGYRKTDTPLPIPLAVKLVAQAAEALAYAHSRVGPDGRPLGIVHRDISPPNLFVTYDGTLKIVDFGIAKASNRTNETQLGKIKGKLAYMAPEQARAGPLDHRADLFALGIVLWEALARCRFVVSDDPVRMMSFIIGKEPFPSPAAKNPEVPPDLAAIVARALSRDPAHRFQNGTQFQLALERWLKVHEFAPTSAHIARHMRTVFAQNVASAQALVESVRAGEQAQARPPRIAPLVPAGARTHSSPQIPNVSVTPSGAHLPRTPSLPQPAFPSPGSQTPNGSQPPHTLPMPHPSQAGHSADAAHASQPPQTSASSQTPHFSETAAVRSPPGQVSAPRALQRGLLAKRTLGGALAAMALFGAISFAAVSSSVKSAPAAKVEELPAPVKLVEAPLSQQPLTPAFSVDAAALNGEPPQEQPEADTNRQLHVQPAKGRLSIVTRPWSEVYLGKKKLGETPLLNVPLSAGRYNLRLINPDTGREKTVSIEVRVQQTTTVKERL